LQAVFVSRITLHFLIIYIADVEASSV
jgi:hypothetical protein